tara:strand:+ start:191 stop:727 length:537 start_codon:yes stop_codon:yes gene_type:complete
MKKSELRKLIRETIREQFSGWESPWSQGQITKKFAAPPLGANCYACVSNGLTGEYGIENVLMTIPATATNFDNGTLGFPYGVNDNIAGSELIQGDLFCGSYNFSYNEMYPWSDYSDYFSDPNFPGPGNDPWSLDTNHLFYTSIAAMEYWTGDRCSGTRPPRPTGPDKIPFKDKQKSRR